MRKEVGIAVLLLFFVSSAAAEARVTDVTPSVVAPGGSFTATVSLTNSGDDSSYFKPLVLEVPDGFRIVEGLDLGDTELCDYCQSEDTVRIQAFESTDSGSYSFEVRPNSSVEDGRGSSDSFHISVDGSPNLLVKLENSTVSQESGDSISVVVENLGNEAAYQVSGSLSIPNVELDPNNLVLGEIGPGEKVSRRISVGTGDSVRPGVKSAQVGLSYRAGSRMISVESEGSVKVLENPELTLSNLQASDPVVGRESRLMVELENVGNGEADSITLNMVCGNSTLNKHKTFVGSLEESESVPAVYQVIPGEKVVNCSVGVNYMGVERASLSRDFQFIAEERDRTDLYLIAAALAVSGVIAVLWRRYR